MQHFESVGSSWFLRFRSEIVCETGLPTMCVVCLCVCQCHNVFVYVCECVPLHVCVCVCACVCMCVRLCELVAKFQISLGTVLGRLVHAMSAIVMRLALQRLARRTSSSRASLNLNGSATNEERH